MSEPILEGVAIIGVHGRFPGAGSVEEFWANLVAGRETISFFSDEDIIASGLDPVLLRKSGAYVPARGVLRDAECFDAAFFGIHPKEAEVMDPQHRVFLETCWEALERGGYAPGRIQGLVGVYAGAMYNTYYMSALHPRPELRELVGAEQVMLGNEKDYIATRVAYKLDLKGPALSMNTGCSSSLVAVCQAYQALVTFQCDMALAGGVSIRSPQRQGYFFQDGNITSPDGHTRTFDAAAQGTVFSNGVTLVLLKRLSEALSDGDQIYAVIKGVALNNDGAQRASFGAPGVTGQSEAVALAQAIAGAEPDSITYIEAHGTATPIGDPIEVAALTQAFRRGTARKQFCAIGSVKSNIGHLDAAAGTAGLIKTALALQNRLLPPSLHFHSPNEKLDIENSPFFVNAELREWKSENGNPLRAGVSSFGTGGTNAHVILEEAPTAEPSDPARPWQILPLSAKTPEALDSSARNLAAHLNAQPSLNLADVAYTLQVGRGEFVHRRVTLCQTVAEAVSLLEQPEPRKVFSACHGLREPPVVFMFPGQGAQYIHMGADVYRQERVFRETVDECARVLRPLLEMDIRHVLFPADGDRASAAEQLRQTCFTQPALFTTEYALAKLWISWGVQPSAMIGHSVGEYVAGCLSGVFSLETALTLVAKRAGMGQAQPAGAMLAVRLSEADLLPLLNDCLSIAAVNSPNLCVVSGPRDAITVFEGKLLRDGIAVKQLQTSHAFHSAMMDPVLPAFTELLRQTKLGSPQIPYISNVTAQWVTDQQTTSPDYWAGHVRQTVRFADGVAELMKDPRRVFLEVGPGQTLSQLASQHPSRKQEQAVLSALGASRDQELRSLLAALGRLWLAGVSVGWEGYYDGERRRRVVLPTYPFERKRYYPQIFMPASALKVEPTPGVCSTPSACNAEALTASDTSAPRAILRREHLASLIRSITRELSGADLESVHSDETFLEIGLDSLLITQAATLFQRKFGVPVSFRQLMEDLGSIENLARYLDENLPSDRFNPSVTPSSCATAAPAPDAVPSSANGALPGSLEQLLEHQMKTTAQLLALVRGQPGIATVLPTALPTAPAAAGTPRAEKPVHGPFRPMDRGDVGGLTEAQQRMLDALITRYTGRTAGSKRLAAQNRPCLADPRSAAGFKQLWKEMVYPIYTERSDGSKIWDVDGNEYVDFVMGFGASLFGHRPPFVVEAVQRQLELGFEIGPIQPMVGEAAALVRELTGMERVAFCNTGSEAVLAAMRAARTVTGRDRIAMFAGDYHGIFDEVLNRPAMVNGNSGSAPIAPGIPHSATSQVVTLEYGSQESLAWLRRHAGELAAVMVEPVQSRRLDLQPREFLNEVRRITDQSQTALIFDEVVTGFRIHPGGAQIFFGVKADIAAYGKVIGGGLPIGVVAGSPKYLDALDGGQWQFGDASFPEVGVTFFAGTFVRHPLTIAVAKAVLEHLKRKGPGLQAQVADLADQAARGIQTLIERYQAPLHLAHFSSLMYLTVRPEWKHGGLLFYLLRERGIHIFENRAFVFTTAHTEEDLARLVMALDDSLRDLAAGGFLPQPQVEHTIPTPPIPPTSEDASTLKFEITEAQREIWMAAMLSEHAARSYNITFLLRMTGSLCWDTLNRSLRTLVERHDSLRASFDLTEPFQRVMSASGLTIDQTDLSGFPPDKRNTELERMARAQGEEALDLSRAPLLRLRLVRLGEDEHVLVMTISHLIADGWSVGVLLHELKLLYVAGGSEQSAALESALQFSDYRKTLGSSGYQALATRAESYWRQQFSTSAPGLELPSDRSRPARRRYRASRVEVHWDAESYQTIRKACARQGDTLRNFLHAGFNVLLHRLSGQTDVVVGVPAAGQLSGALQEIPGARALVGQCVNLLPVRSSCQDNLSFAEYLKSLKRVMLDAFEHQDMTFGRLLQRLNIARDSGRVPLVQVTFNVDRAVDLFQMDKVQVRVEELSRSALVFDLSVNIVADERGVAVCCDFSTDLFDPETIRSWLGHFHTLIEAAAKTPELGVFDLPLLSGDERRELVYGFNEPCAVGGGSELPTDGGATLHELFEARVRRSPESVALVCGGGRLTYGQLDSEANRLACRLRRCGVKPDTLVGLCLERSSEMVVAILAILKAGGAYLPIDLAYPADRIAFMLEDARAPVLLTQKKLLGSLPSMSAGVLCVDEVMAEPMCSSGDAGLLSAARPDHLSYVIYTSGTTGKPKGTMITHRNVVRLFSATEGWFGFNERDVWTLFHSTAFDFSVWEIWGALLYGGRLVIVPHLVSRSPEAFYELLAGERVTVLNQTPSAFRQLIQAEEAVGRKDLALRYVIFGGEALEMQSLRPWFERHGDQKPKLVNMYGITETTVHVTYRPLSRDDLNSGSVIGIPIPDLQVYILDAQRQPVPVGVPGEMYVGGAGLARGYLNRPDLTGERFVPDLLTGRDGAQLYRTGDLARFLPGRDIEYLGRVDHQVKIRGYRIELGEIESVLCQHPGVREALVMAREDTPGTKQLAAYLVTNSPRPALKEIREHLGKKLPDYMVPAAFVFLDKFPLTNNGKIDRKALPAPEQDRPELAAAYVAPRTELETALAGIWQEVLRVDRVGVHDNFFELGGHSILAVKAISRIRQQLAVDVSLSALFECATVAGMALRVVEMEAAKLDCGELAALLGEIEALDGNEVGRNAGSDR